eukprot:13848573-Ditylum_brightwellii.AAC.1
MNIQANTQGVRGRSTELQCLIKKILDNFLTSKNMTAINDKLWFKRVTKCTKNAKYDAEHNDHNNYTNII